MLLLKTHLIPRLCPTVGECIIYCFAVIAETVADCITNVSRGRLFAVVYVAGKQYKVTDYDLIRTDGFMSANVGDKIRLEKVPALNLVKS